MKKTIIVLLCSILSTISITAKNPSKGGNSFTQGTTVGQAMLGLGGVYGLPITLVAEHGITDKIGIGGMLGYARYSTSLPVYGNYAINNILIGARGHYHAYTTDKIDAYGAISIGYNLANISYPSTFPTIAQTATAGGIFASGNIGGRYYFNPKLAAVAEIGYGVSYLNIGVAMKF
jgi:hypothetical protein